MRPTHVDPLPPLEVTALGTESIGLRSNCPTFHYVKNGNLCREKRWSSSPLVRIQGIA